MSYLATSSHYSNWIFTREELERIDRIRHAKVKKDYKEMQKHNPSGRTPRAFACTIPASSLSSPEENELEEELTPDEAASIETVEFLTLEEEAQLRRFYQEKVQDSCSQLFRTSDKVKSSAVFLYKRFYLSNSVMEFHPKYIVPTVVYVAGKVEEQYINVDTIAELLQVDHKDVISHEMILLSGVRFQLIMYHPFRSLLAFVDDLRVASKASDGETLQVEFLQKLHAKSCEVVNEMMLTDLPLLCNASMLAVCALWKVCCEFGSEAPEIEKYLLNSTEFHDPSHGQKIIQQLQKLLELYNSERTGTSAQVNIKAIYKKVKAFYPASGESKEPKKKKRKKDKKSKTT